MAGSVMKNLKRGVHFGELLEIERIAREAAASNGGTGLGGATVSIAPPNQAPNTGAGSIWAVQNKGLSKVHFGTTPPPADANVPFWVDTEVSTFLEGRTAQTVTISKKQNPSAETGSLWLVADKGYRTVPVNLLDDQAHADFGDIVIEK